MILMGLVVIVMVGSDSTGDSNEGNDSLVILMVILMGIMVGG